MKLRAYLAWMTVYSMILGYPKRLRRFVFHFLQGFSFIRKYHLPSNGIVEWLVDLLCYTTDLLLFPDFLEFVLTLIQSDLRTLTDDEMRYARKYFNDKVDLSNVRISYSMPRRVKLLAMAFVSFNTIHFSKRISLPVFIHEMVHVWQFQQFGSVYIFRALKAQQRFECYEYGGLENLYSRMIEGYDFVAFNFEQQGKIFEDYCRLNEAGELDQPLARATFEYFISQVRNSHDS